jgi:hypothetical protein
VLTCLISIPFYHNEGEVILISAMAMVFFSLTLLLISSVVKTINTRAHLFIQLVASWYRICIYWTMSSHVCLFMVC